MSETLLLRICQLLQTLKGFLNRVGYTREVKEIDEILAEIKNGDN